MTTPSYTQLPPSSTGDKVDEVTLTNVNGDSVRRQVGAIGDPDNVGAIAGVGIDGRLAIQDYEATCLLTNILIELRVCSRYLQTIANSVDDPATLRQDFSNPLQ